MIDHDRQPAVTTLDRQFLPERIEPRSAARRRIAGIGIACVWLVLAARLVWLQWWQHEQLAARAERIQTFVETIPAWPGDIVDRNGRTLATSTVAMSLFVDPARVEDPGELAQRIAPIVNLDPRAVREKIEQRRDRRFLWIARRLTDEQAAAIRELTLPANVVGLRPEFLRHYPQEAVAGHLIGLRDIDNRGRGGLEQAWDVRLRGVDGERTLRRDARGYVVDILDEVSRQPEHGSTVVSTIDLLLQIEAEEVADRVMEQWLPKSAAILVLEPHSGDILAMVSRPAFDPSRPELASSTAWKNHCVAAIFEPGSTFKPFLVAWAVDQQLLSPDEEIDCHFGAYRMGPRVLHDHHRYGRLSVCDVLVKSSNIGMAKIGERLTNAGLQDAVRSFGFGRLTGCGLPGELPGIVRPDDAWDGYSTGSIPMGQEIAVTPMQLIAAHGALANGGRLVAPRVVRQIGRQSGVKDVPQIVSPIISAATCRWLITEPMREVVTRGTGTQARLEGVDVFGKTGTSQVVDPVTGRYSHTRHICSFVCGAPADSPRVIVLVMVEEPSAPGVHYGGTVAAPAAKEVLRAALSRLDELDSSAPPAIRFLTSDESPPTR